MSSARVWRLVSWRCCRRLAWARKLRAVMFASEVAETETDEQPLDQDRGGGAELLDAEAGAFGAAGEAFAGDLPASAAVGVDVFVVAVAGLQFVVGDVGAGQRAEATPVVRARE